MKVTINLKFYLLSLVIIGLLFLLFVAESNLFPTRSWQQAWNLGHIPLFVLAGYVIYYFYTALQDKNLLAQAFILVLISCGVGLFIEFIQSFVGRQASVQDVILDMTGGLISVVIFSQRTRTFGLYQKGLSVILVVLVILLASRTVIISILDEYHARSDFPMLGDFERPGELGRWTSVEQMEISGEVSITGNKSLKVSLTPRAYSGVELEYFPGDWSEYRTLGMSIYVANSVSIFLTVSIIDGKHISNRFAFNDRYTKRFELQAGWNEVNISLHAVKHAPRKRQMDMTNIRGLRLFVVRPVKIQHIYIDGIRLDK